MRKLMLFLFLTVFASALQAQTAAPPAAKACIWKSIWTPKGTGTEWVRTLTEFGGVKVAGWAYWCPQDDGRWAPVTHLCVVGRGCLDPATLTGILDTAARSADPVAALFEARKASTMPVLPSEQAAWALAEGELVQAAARIRPPDLVWQVLPNPSSTSTPPTRPMFSAADPTKQVSERATVGALCNCAKPVPKGTQTLCPLASVNGSTPSSNLTACARQP